MVYGCLKMKIGVLIPLYRNSLTSDEELSLQQLRRYLSSYELIIVKPENLESTTQANKVVSFPDNYFLSISSYSRLLLTTQFYESIINFDYVLIYQLDCLVFNDNLQEYCELGYDYIGSPLFRRYSAKPILSRVGNGGFSLRRVEACLDVLNSKRFIESTPPFINHLLTAEVPDLDEWSVYQRWLKKIRVLRSVRKGVTEYADNYTMNEDLFWSDRAKLFYPAFKIAPMDVALRFAFDKNPRFCYEMNNYKLPFGAHAWNKWDRAFWEQFLPK